MNELNAHLGAKLREMFDSKEPEALPAKMVELLAALDAQNVSGPSASRPMKDDLIAEIPNLRAFAMSLCGNRERADDLVQETLLKAWNNSGRFQEGTNLRAWLFTILRNSFVSEIRKRRREVEDADGKIAERVISAPAQHAYVEMKDLLKALDLLPPLQREAVVLVGAAGMSYEEAAEITKCAVGTIKSRVNRARTKLAEHLGGDGADLLPSAS